MRASHYGTLRIAVPLPDDAHDLKIMAISFYINAILAKPAPELRLIAARRDRGRRHIATGSRLRLLR